MTHPLKLALVLLAGFLVFYFDARTPAPAPAEAPPSSFSAARAMADVALIGARAHPIGSEENYAVRDALLARMDAMGLSPRVQRASSAGAGRNRLVGGTVENIIGVLPGDDREAPALALMAHYDSAPGSPGAADDAVGVAAILETVRALGVDGAPKRDVIVLITDGEEPNLLGARAFFASDPLADHVGYVVNLEARGGGGRATMFQTAAQNGADIALFRRAGLAATGNSLSSFVYKYMPNGTDFTVSLQAGKPGLNFAFIGRQFDYHAPTSTPETLDPGALQHIGDQTLAIARAAAFGDLPARAPDAVYANLPAGPLVAYPYWAGWLILLVAAALAGWTLARARAQAGWNAWDVMRGAGASLYLLTMGAALIATLRRLTGVGEGWYEFRPLLARFALFEALMLAGALLAIFAVAFACGRGRARFWAAGAALLLGAAGALLGKFDPVTLGLGVAGAGLGFFVFAKPARAMASWGGMFLVGLAAAIAAQAFAPPAAFALAWPLLAASVIAALLCGGRVIESWIAAIAAVFALAWAGGFLHAMLQALDLPLLTAFVIWLGAPALWLFAFPREAGAPRAWSAAAIAAAAAAGLSLWLHVSSPWSARHPDLVAPILILDTGENRAWRASLAPPNAYLESVLEADSGAIGPRELPFFGQPIWAADARAPMLPPPAVDVSADGEGRVTLRWTPREGATGLLLALKSDAPLTAFSVNGAESDWASSADKWARIQWTTAEELTIAFHADDPSALDIRAAEILSDWRGETALAPPPKHVAFWDIAGSTIVLGAPAIAERAAAADAQP